MPYFLPAAEIIATLAAALGALLGLRSAKWMHLSRIFPFTKSTTVTLEGGKEEYIDASKEDWHSAIKEYLIYERTVRDALARIAESEVETSQAAGFPDFFVRLHGADVAVEAKTFARSISARQLTKLLEAREVDKLLLVTPSPIPEEEASRLKAEIKDGVIAFASGTDIGSLIRSIENATASFSKTTSNPKSST